MTEVGIIGGGMLGLTLGTRLAQRGHGVTVFEAAAQVGGLASADAIGDLRWDRFYHVILGRDAHLLRLLKDVGLDDRLRWSTTRTGFYTRGAWHSMSSAFDFLRFPPLSLMEKLRLGLTILGASRIRDGTRLEETTAVEWLTRWSGKRTVQEVWLPLLRSKLGPHAEEASAAFIWAIIRRMYGAREAGMKREMMGYVDGGYDVILPAVRRYAEQAGVRIVNGATVTSVSTRPSGAAVTFADGSSAEFGDVVLTVPCPTVSRLCPQLGPPEHAKLARVVYMGVVCPSFLLRRPLNGYYVTNITDGGFPFTGVIETSALVNPRSLGGRHLVYLPRYLSQGDALWNESDDAIADGFFAALCRMVPGLTPADVVARRVARAREVLAVSTRRYSAEVMPAITTSLPHVFVANSAQIAQGTLNVDETVALAERSARQLGPLLGADRVALAHA